MNHPHEDLGLIILRPPLLCTSPTARCINPMTGKDLFLWQPSITEALCRLGRPAPALVLILPLRFWIVILFFVFHAEPSSMPRPSVETPISTCTTQISSAPFSIWSSRYRKCNLYPVTQEQLGLPSIRRFFIYLFYNMCWFFVFFTDSLYFYPPASHSEMVDGIIRSILEGITHQKMHFHKELKFPPSLLLSPSLPVLSVFPLFRK